MVAWNNHGAGVKVAHPAVSGGLNLTYGTGGTYGGFDRFGRVIDQRWEKDNQTVVDRYTYGYDMNSNRLYRENAYPGLSGFDELYSYDNLNRLLDMARGDLNAARTALTSAVYTQDWTLDQLGNWAGMVEDPDGDGLLDPWEQTREHNDVNEITGIDDPRGWVEPVYDAAGNMTSGPRPGEETVRNHYAYDAWNRMVGVRADDAQNPGQPGDLIATYEYDGQTRRIEKTVGQTAEDTFFNEQWQVLEVRLDGDAHPLEQWVWDLRYIDAAVVRFRDGNTDGDYADLNYEDNGQLVVGVDSILFYCNDANMNVTALVDGAADTQASVTAGQVVERANYAAFGAPEIRDADWNLQTFGSAYLNSALFAGYRYNAETGLYLVRNRVYHAELGRWVQRDPAGYANGLNASEYCTSLPTMVTDPKGLWIIAQCVNKADYGVWNLIPRRYHPDVRETGFSRGGRRYKAYYFRVPQIDYSTIRSEIITSMLTSSREFAIEGDTAESVKLNLTNQLMAREHIGAVAAESRIIFRTGYDNVYNTDLWVPDNGAFAPGKDILRAYEDLGVIYDKPMYETGCAMGTSLVMHWGIGRALKEAKADESQLDALKHPWPPRESPALKTFPNAKGPTAQPPLGDWVPGDWGHVKNPIANPRRGEEGENIVYVGNKLWWGLTPAGGSRTVLDGVDGWAGNVIVWKLQAMGISNPSPALIQSQLNIDWPAMLQPWRTGPSLGLDSHWQEMGSLPARGATVT